MVGVPVEVVAAAEEVPEDGGDAADLAAADTSGDTAATGATP